MSVTFVHDPQILACLGAKLDVVVRCSGSLSELIKLYLQGPITAERRLFRALKPPHKDERALALALDEPDKDKALIPGTKTITDILESLSDNGNFASNKFSLDSVAQIHRAIVKVTHHLYSWSNKCSPGILALTGSERLALVPKRTQCGDMVAGLMLPSRTKSNNTFLICSTQNTKWNLSPSPSRLKHSTFAFRSPLRLRGRRIEADSHANSAQPSKLPFNT